MLMKANLSRIFPYAARQSGGGLLEVLISLVIVAFGMLGMANLQASSLRFQKTAHFRATANAALFGMAERLRANVLGVRAGNYATLPADVYTEKFKESAPVCAVQGACTPAEIAALDIFHWRQDLARSLPGGWGDIAGDIENGLTLRVYFKEPGLGKVSSNDSDVTCRPAANAGSTIRCFALAAMP